MKVQFKPGSFSDIACDLLVVPVLEGEAPDSEMLQKLDKATRGVLRRVLASGEFKPELHNACLIHNPAGLKAGRLLLLGAGKKAELDLARVRELAGAAARGARSSRCKSVALLRRDRHAASDAVRVISEGALYGNYELDIYKTRDKEEVEIETFFIVDEAPMDGRKADEAIRRGTVIGEATNLARTLANEPSNVLTPSRFAEIAEARSREAGLELEVLEREDMERLGMNTLLAVARGSDEPPKLMVLRIKNESKKKKARNYAFVGKGVTFDSGGISIKPADRMEDMKADMAGGAAVLGAMVALAQLQPLKHNVIGLIPAVENLPSGKATRPGDVVKSYLGKTVEIINTDAEGRLILADALAYARNLGASHLVDIATLTGACAVALGAVYAGMMGTDRATIETLQRNCGITGEKLWQLPIDDEYKKAIRSEIADMKNVGNRLGGAITAAKFLQEFAEDVPWVHLDIAGVDLDHEGRQYAAKGATGFGVRTLVQLLL
jgi:leucyl aminopeptidase